MKILYVDPFSIPHYLGGSHKSLLAIMKTIRDSGHQVVLATPGDGLLEHESKNKDIATVRFTLPLLKETRSVTGKNRGFSISTAIYDVLMLLMASLSIFKLILKLRPDVVHSNQMLISISCGLAATVAEVPSVWHIRENPSSHVPGVVKKVYGFLAYIFSDVIMVNSQYSAGLFKDTLAEDKILIAPIGIETIVDGKTRGVTDPKLVSIFGRVVKMKGHDVLIRALNILKQKRQTNLKLMIYGHFDEDDPYYLSLLGSINEFNLEEDVQFCGFRSDIDAALEASSIIVSPSVESESFGRTLIEAMAAGKPVIASRIGAHPEIVESGVSGILVEADDPDALAQALQLLLADEAMMTQMGQAGRNRYTDHYTLEKYHRDMETLYMRLVNQ